MPATGAPSPKQIIRPYGDRLDDGLVQLSFVLPVPASEKAKEAARQFVKKMGFADVQIATMQPAGDTYAFFVCYGRTQMYLDYAEIHVPEVLFKKLPFDELNDAIEHELGRKIVVVGGCTGTDAHAVGIDAIMNMKGFAQDYGLERYRMFEAVNLGSQVENAAILARAIEQGADAILVSQVVTQRDVHKDNSRDLVDRVQAKGLREKLLLVLGGPRIDHKLALELGFDAGFGPGTKPSDVANWLFQAVLAKARAAA